MRVACRWGLVCVRDVAASRWQFELIRRGRGRAGERAREGGCSSGGGRRARAPQSMQMARGERAQCWRAQFSSSIPGRSADSKAIYRFPIESTDSSTSRLRANEPRNPLASPHLKESNCRQPRVPEAEAQAWAPPPDPHNSLMHCFSPLRIANFAINLSCNAFSLLHFGASRWPRPLHAMC